MSEPSANTTAQADAATAPSPHPPEQHTPLALPAPPEHKEDDPVKLDVNGEAFSLYDRLGPTVVNSDGTLSRIANWAEMGEAERARILRVLGARNQIRLEAKKAELEANSGSGEQAGSA
ncbi:hypothetical protein JCM8097_003553 [Rhodosporidiobolus ruineniae]